MKKKRVGKKKRESKLSYTEEGTSGGKEKYTLRARLKKKGGVGTEQSTWRKNQQEKKV